MSQRTTQLEELNALDALLAARTLSPEEIGARLDKLGSPNTPDAVQYHLRLLLAANRPQDAADLAQSREPHQVWCEYAIRASALVGDSAAARSLLEWARSNADLDLFHRCVVAAAAGLMEHQFATRPNLAPPLTPEDTESLQVVQDTLSGVLLHIEARKRVRTPVEMRATVYALRVAVLLGDRLRVERLASLLFTYSPVSLELAQLALSGAIACPEELPDRLRREQSDSFEAQLAATLLLDECQNDHAAAFNHAKALIPRASDEKQKRELAAVLVQAGQHHGTEGLQEARTLAAILLSPDDPLLPMIEAAVAIRAKDAGRADRLLHEHVDENSGYWHQLVGQVRLLQERTDDAVKSFRRAVALVPHPSLLKSVSSLALDANRADVAADLLEQVVTAHPEDLEAKRSLGRLYLSQRKYSNAIDTYGALVASDQVERADRMNLAYAFTMTNRLSEAIAEYTAVCAMPDPPLAALIARSQLYHADGDPKAGFDLLVAIRDQYWDDYRFVGAFMQIAFAAGEDAEASSALSQLKALQDQGKTDSEVLHAASLDDVLEQGRQYQKQTRLVSEQLLTGRLPWIIADAMLRRDPCWAWTIRTQPRSWLREDPVVRAQYSVYSTNGFSVQRDDDGNRSLTLIQPSHGPVVADITALLTVSKLGILNETIDLFGEIHIPTAYLGHAVEEATRLVDHQASRRSTADTVRQAIDARRVRSVDDSFELPAVDEYTDDNEAYRLADLLALLNSAQLLGVAQRSALQSLCKQPPVAPDARPLLRRGQRVRIDLLTLESIAGIGVLDPVVNSLVLAISTEDHERLVAETYGYQQQDDVRKWQRELWAAIRDDERVKAQAASPLPGIEGLTHDSLWHLGLASASLSRELSLPLLADDRVPQALSSDTPDMPPSFGSDAVVDALIEHGSINASRAASLYLQLMKWRYRFILPGPEILKALADEFKHSLPGASLRLLAQYAHDCMRDVGLFAGFEATDPPSTMADRVYQHWVYLVAEFLVLVWQDESGYSTQQASALTHWALTELLPGLPVNLLGRAPRMADLMPSMVISRFMVYLAPNSNYVRCRVGLAAVASGLGLSPAEARRAELEVIDAL